MVSLRERLTAWVGEVIIVDCVSRYVVIGTLAESHSDYLELTEADVHDLRDTTTSRELYLVKTRQYGVQQNRARVLFRMAEVVAISRLEDVSAD